MSEDSLGFGFVCVRNAGRSQMATAFAERERARRDLDGAVEIVTGGTDPAGEVHPEVVEAMADLGIDIADRVPREVDRAELDACDVVATMGCSTLELDADVAARDWDLPDPHGKSDADVREIRDEVQRRVAALFDEVGEPGRE